MEEINNGAGPSNINIENPDHDSQKDIVGNAEQSLILEVVENDVQKASEIEEQTLVENRHMSVEGQKVMRVLDLVVENEDHGASWSGADGGLN